jgi:hypothetical protein
MQQHEAVHQHPGMLCLKSCKEFKSKIWTRMLCTLLKSTKMLKLSKFPGGGLLDLISLGGIPYPLTQFQSQFLGTCVLYGPHLFFLNNSVWFGQKLLIYTKNTLPNLILNVSHAQVSESSKPRRSQAPYSATLATWQPVLCSSARQPLLCSCCVTLLSRHENLGIGIAKWTGCCAHLPITRR